MGLFDRLFGRNSKDNQYKRDINESKKLKDEAIHMDKRRNNIATSIKKLEEELKLYEGALSIDPNDINAWNDKGVTLYKLAKDNEAMQCFDKALNIDPNNIRALKYKGILHSQSGRHAQAIQCYDKILNINPHPNDALIWNNKGVALHVMGRDIEALQCYDRALKIDPNYELARENREISLEMVNSDESKAILLWETIINSGNPFIELRKHAKEIDGDFLDIAKSEARRHSGIFIFTELAAEAIEIFNELNYARQDVNTANLYHQPVQLVDDEKILDLKRTGKKVKNGVNQLVREVASTYRENPDGFIDLLEKLPAPENEKGDLFLDVGARLFNFSYFPLALASWEHALKYLIENKDKAGESACCTNLGVAYANLGDLKKAIKYHEDSLKINKEIGDIAGESACYGNLGVAYRNLGDFNKAIEYYEKSLGIAENIGDKSGESKCYTGLGNAYANLGDFKKAIKYHEDSLKINKEIGDKVGESACYGNLGNAYDCLGDFNKAIEYYEKSLGIAENIGDKSGESKCYANLGNAYANLGDFKKAIKYYEKSLKIVEDIGDKEAKSICYVNLASVYYIKQDYQKSLEYAKESIKLTEQVRESLVQEELSLTFLKTKIGVYDLAINSAINLYRETDNKDCIKDALEIIERIKSRELIKKLKIKKKQDPELEKENNELEKIETQIEVLEAKIKGLREDMREMPKEVITELDDLYKDKSELSNEIWLKSADPSSLTPSVDLNLLNSFWGSFNNYKDNCTILQMYEQEKRIIYILFDKENFEFFEKEITEEEIKNLVNPLKSMRSSPVSPDTFYGFLEHVLNSILPEILKERLGNIKTGELFIIPHKHLHQIPWEAVVVDEKPLCVKYNLIRHYSLDLIRSSLSHPKKDNRSALIVSNPTLDLKGAKEECIEVENKLKGYKINPLYEDDAKLEHVKNSLAKVSLAHFACHAKFNIENPFASKILLNDQSFIATDISMMDFNFYPFIFLNACETERSEVKSFSDIESIGDEQIGFVRAFAMAHSPSIVATGWEIDVDIAKYFGKKFYSAISDCNLISALRFAKEETYDKFKDESKDWAAYVLYGSPYRKL